MELNIHLFYSLFVSQFKQGNLWYLQSKGKSREEFQGIYEGVGTVKTGFVVISANLGYFEKKNNQNRSGQKSIRF